MGRRRGWYNFPTMRHLAKHPDDMAAEPIHRESAVYEPRTSLGRKLMVLRKQIERSGEPLLDWEDLNLEIAERRGERRS
jgi:hypothetical protein